MPELSESFQAVENTNKLIKIFPNPSNDYLQIDYEFSHRDNLTGKLYDNKGRVIKIILNENFQSETNSIKLDISTLSSGMYFVNIQSNSETVMKSFIKE